MTVAEMSRLQSDLRSEWRRGICKEERERESRLTTYRRKQVIREKANTITVHQVIGSMSQINLGITQERRANWN